MSSLKRAFIDPDKCQGCTYCTPGITCPAKAIEDEDGFKYVSPSCSGCGQCSARCPYRAIRMI